ncbi:XRE family transcriptional regulator [Paraburkholderia flagellata]|uniref:XRE family transcriptional regulator n=1 Tax=Paraburkholderia flagellata TaxID=2883241 RepID=UPI001F1741D4|nr:XRE family transcriptional regulator [Paraburkholderia flagellata]
MDTQNLPIRPECFRSAASWTPPTGEEVAALVRHLGWSSSQTAAFLGLTTHRPGTAWNDPDARKAEGGSRKVRQWIGGATAIPYSLWALLAYKAGYGPIWDQE